MVVRSVRFWMYYDGRANKFNDAFLFFFFFNDALNLRVKGD